MFTRWRRANDAALGCGRGLSCIALRTDTRFRTATVRQRRLPADLHSRGLSGRNACGDRKRDRFVFSSWPENDGDLAAFMQRLTITHVRCWQEHRYCVGAGHVYQGRYKSFPVETKDYLYHVLRYVERNPLRANLVSQAEDWRWSSLWRRTHGSADQRRILHRWPVPCPRRWLELVNEPQTESELEAIRKSVNGGQPYGASDRVEQTASKLGLESTLRKRGRPRKASTES